MKNKDFQKELAKILARQFEVEDDPSCAKDHFEYDIAQAQQAITDLVLETIDEHDPSTHRRTGKSYWGNTLRSAVQDRQRIRKAISD